MLRIPGQSKQFTQPNTSDIVGNIYYSKNVDLKEAGYVRLSPRAVALFSDESIDPNYDTDFNTAASIGRYGSSFYLATGEEPFKSTLTTTTFTVTEDLDTSNPSLATGSRGRWWQNRWYVSTSTAVFYKTIAGGAWTSAITGLTTATTHPLEVFRNRNTLCVGNGNVVQQYTTAHATGTDLTIPADFEVTGLSYSNNRLGVITKLSTTATGQNQDAYFFVWDGATTSANGGFPVGTNEIAAITPYKGSWMLLTKKGELLYFNGGGFQQVAILPFLAKQRLWDSSDMRGDTMITDGDLIYIHISGVVSLYGAKQESSQQNYNGGILCYDPKVGIYHAYSPSISTVSLMTVAGTENGINLTSNVLTTTTGTIPATGNPIKYTYNTNNPIGGLTGGTVYYIIKHTATTFSLAETKEDAINGVKIDLTSYGANPNYFLALNLLDYGQSYMILTGGMVTTDTKNVIYDGLVFSGRYYNQAGTNVNYFEMLSSGFKNIGYWVSPKIESESVQDIWQKVYVKYRPLKSGDSIVVKMKDKEVVGIPASTPQRGQSCTWTSSTTFTTIADLSEIDTYLDTSGNECEVEITSGAGAGQMSQISSISESGGTYTVTLTDEIEGASSGRTCNVKIENWKLLKTTAGASSITSSDTVGYMEFPISTNSKSIFFKVILSGSDVTMEDFQIINKTNTPSV